MIAVQALIAASLTGARSVDAVLPIVRQRRRRQHCKDGKGRKTESDHKISPARRSEWPGTVAPPAVNWR